MTLFAGFEQRRLSVNATEINLVHSGSGPALLLLHGYPQTHVLWHLVAPELAKRFTVVVPDMRGYGDSAKPVGGGDHTAYSKRTMAQDMVEVMSALGHERFSLAGHDRGARVAYRLAFDHPERVTKVAILDVVPTHAQWSAMDWRRAIGAHHWLFLAQPEPFPEHMIGLDPVFYLHSRLSAWAGAGFVFDPEAMAEYERCFSDPASIHATCEDYRAGATVDFAIDDADYGRRKISAPLLALWGETGNAVRRSNIVETWKEWAEDVRGQALECGHFLPEERPQETAAALAAFFSET